MYSFSPSNLNNLRKTENQMMLDSMLHMTLMGILNTQNPGENCEAAHRQGQFSYEEKP